MTLSEFFTIHKKVCIAFSGGVDSAYLLYAAVKSGAEVSAYYVKSAFQPAFELNDALRLSEELNISLKVIETDILSYQEVTSNPCDRCYYCKYHIFNKIITAAAEDGFDTILDGTNASDEEGDRPGMKVLTELKVLSPLRICGLTKDRIRELSREAGLFTADKPAYACLATRVPTGEAITAEKLSAIEQSEDYLFSLGFSDFRVRTGNGAARIQVREADLERLLRYREKISEELGKYYSAVLLDIKNLR